MVGYDLRKAWENFKSVCRNVFRDKPEHLKTLKITEKKTGTVKRKPAKDRDGGTTSPEPAKVVVPSGQSSDEIME